MLASPSTTNRTPTRSHRSRRRRPCGSVAKVDTWLDDITDLVADIPGGLLAALLIKNAIDDLKAGDADARAFVRSEGFMRLAAGLDLDPLVVQRRALDLDPGIRPPAPPRPPPIAELTPETATAIGRLSLGALDQDVLIELLAGWQYLQIAAHHHLPLANLNSRVHRLYARLGVRRRAELAAWIAGVAVPVPIKESMPAPAPPPVSEA